MPGWRRGRFATDERLAGAYRDACPKRLELLFKAGSTFSKAKNLRLQVTP
jgi:hypothetical protein